MFKLQPKITKLVISFHLSVLIRRTFNTTITKKINNESFFGAFIQSVKKQVKENKELEQNLKTLEAKGQTIVDIKYLNRAKILFDKAKSELNNNKAAKLISEGFEELNKHAKAAGKSVEEVMKELNESQFITFTREQVKKLTSFRPKE